MTSIHKSSYDINPLTSIMSDKLACHTIAIVKLLLENTALCVGDLCVDHFLSTILIQIPFHM